MRQSKTQLRGSVTQNNTSVRLRGEDDAGIGFLARLGILAALLIALIGGIVALWHAGWPQRKANDLAQFALSLTQKAQFEVRDVVVEGRRQSSKDEVIDAISTQRGTAILAVDTDEAAERLSKLPWVGSAVVERRLPDTLTVILTERVPAARWQHEDKTAVIDAEGKVLPSAKAENFPALMLVVGTGAEHEAQALFAALKDYPNVRDKVSSAVRVGERRWDLRLLPKVTARLPEQNMQNALRRLSVLIDQERILNQDIVAIDLRVPDRLAIEPATPQKPAAEARP